MNIESSKSLRMHNSFGFDIIAEYFTTVESVDQLAEAFEWSKQHNYPTLILGGGSNSVFTTNVKGLVIHIAIPGVETQPHDDPTSVLVSVGAGVNWHNLVVDTLRRKHFGLENLALIPGYAGAAPIQNIGAYGIEIAELVTAIEVLSKTSGEQLTLSPKECEFGYRHSFFKTSAGSEFIVTSINMQLSLLDEPTIRYQALQTNLETQGLTNPHCQQIFDTVCEIRRSKLPDPADLGNAGSFFKNPVISRQQLDTILTSFNNTPHFKQTGGGYKIPAGWLIDRAGWKGHRNGPVGVHSEQALVLVNHGGGNGQQIAILAEQIREDIQTRFGVTLEREPALY